MNRKEALSHMIPPGKVRDKKPAGGVVQIHLTRACDNACFGCTQGSNLNGKCSFISLENFELACKSLKNYFGTVGVFGGNPALHPRFPEICEILASNIPFERRGVWCNNPRGHGRTMRETFNPSCSNLNVHLSREAYDEFKRDWPESRPFGLHDDSRHSPPYVAMQDVVHDESERWDMISNCDINQYWSAMICEIHGELRGFFCEIAGAQSILHQYDDGYPDLGVSVSDDWWKAGMEDFSRQVDYHCHACGVPLRGHGALACGSNEIEQTSETHLGIYNPKKKDRLVELVTCRDQLGDTVEKSTDYMGNARR